MWWSVVVGAYSEKGVKFVGVCGRKSFCWALGEGILLLALLDAPLRPVLLSYKTLPRVGHVPPYMLKIGCNAQSLHASFGASWVVCSS